MHVGEGMLLLLVAATHVMLNWKWIQITLLNNGKKKKP
jgi:hypothetical protein